MKKNFKFFFITMLKPLKKLKKYKINNFFKSLTNNRSYYILEH